MNSPRAVWEQSRTKVICSNCEAILVRGNPHGSVSHGLCAPCAEDLYGDFGTRVAAKAGIGPEDPVRNRLIREYQTGLESDDSLTVWTKAVEAILWIRTATDEGIELVSAEVLACDSAGNWYALDGQLEQRSFAPAEVIATSVRE